MSLKRRADSKGYSGGNSGGSGTPLESTFEYAKLTIGSAFGKEAFNCMKLSSTIDKVGDGVSGLGVAEYSKVDLRLRQTAARLTNKIQAGLKQQLRLCHIF
ncbi:hypothetical protein BASA61_001153 [Batrachochytrium salamandrivorans]|nr:hypothetical protein BASA61_001153 [Batrachochytrium salamandrivorans]